jgi:hypothetical protein
MAKPPVGAGGPAKPFSFRKRLREIDRFFQGRDPVHQTMRRTARRLVKAGIAYAIVGGMALNAHGYQRTTGDMDFLLTADGFERFRTRFAGKYYDSEPGRPRRLVDRANGIKVGILVTGRFPGTGKRGPFAFPNPSEVSEVIDKHRVVNLLTLVELKLAVRQYRDFGDVVELLRVHNLDEAFAGQLHPSVHEDFIECLEEKRCEDEYEAREE